MIIAKFLHILGFTVWVGGMFFAHNALRPVVAVTLEPPQRLTLLSGVFTKFFLWVWISIALVFASGMAMMAGMGKPPMHVMLMFVLGVIMMLIFAHIFFAPYRRLKRAVAAQDWKTGGAAMATIRKLVAINLVIGLLTIAIGALGPLAL
ncbi:CopD family protein [Herminiimonas fonticola]|uniref:Putative membrane protein n=1 Tax=Herminiimonas fonticola TaxID=303380 RepID=A0A4R6GIE5_9BURK|nr:CopD family protein [Herminiimonas fonticola]RBA24930.1 putative integral membrane protein [Herminiimonas fonticola]TDN94044.1 putative membrane protein [Herminiimonas fonticola]